MSRHYTLTLLVTLALAVPAGAVQPPQRVQRVQPQRAQMAPSVERWVRQLESEIDHLQEDLYYQRGSYPRGLDEQVEQASQAVTHFHQVLRRTNDPQHLMRDFEEMDQQVHQLVDRLRQSGDSWLRRQASRISYPDEQLHYVLQTRFGDAGYDSRELLARHAHTLENEAKTLLDLVDRVGRRDDAVRRAIEEFADEAEHFHQVVERGADLQHLRDDFRSVDESWRRVVNRLNQSSHGLYLRRTAENVNRVYSQIHQLLTEGQGPGVEPPQRPQRPQRVERRQGRPAVEFEIPGIGRFRIPR